MNKTYYFSAPGRTELGGNHTDHQHGCGLAAAIDLSMTAKGVLNESNIIRVVSQGYAPFEIDLGDLSYREAERGTTLALVRGIAGEFTRLGVPLQGFNMEVSSQVLPGSGLSSSAAYEVLIGTIVNHLYFEGKVSQPEIAMIGQYAENVYFGKPCGLMDQMASAVGSMVTIDFFDKENPVIEKVDFDFAACGHALCIIDSRASHADLTDEYAAITLELKDICSHFGKDVLTQIAEADFVAAIPVLREKFGDRAVLRAYHFYKENARVLKQVAALKNGDFDTFLRLVKESGYSSYMYLQNVIPAGYREHQDVALSLSLCETYLGGRGAYRVHGGGFAGTVQAFVPMDILEDFRKGIDAVLGEGACHVLSIRPHGGVEAYINA